MRKNLLILSIIIFILQNSNAQNQLNKGSIWDTHILNDISSSTKIEILVKGDKAEIQQLCKKYQASILYQIRDIYRVSIAKKDFTLFAQESSKLRVSHLSTGGQQLMDTARVWNNVDSAYMGYAPLTQSYTGNGVVVGLIDDGIYFNHPDFKNPDSTTRIKFLWDQNYATSPSSPFPYNYGKEWNYIDINNGTCTHTEQGSAGHGTHVAGIAAGNGNADSNHRANAPKADIIAVSVKYGVNFLTNVVDAVDYIFKKADAMGKPCVINTSIGDYYGARDGKDLVSEAIENLLDERGGRVLVAAAGNAGNINYHAQYNFTGTDTVFSFFKDAYTGNKYYIDFWADSNAFRNAYFTIEAIDTGTYVKQGNTGFINIKREMPSLPFIGNVTLTRNIANSLGFFQGQVKYVATLVGTTYHVECEITPDTTNKVWSLKFCGQGKADVWAEKTLIGTSNFVKDSSVISIPNYVFPDFNQTIVSYWQCSDKVITVGNYVNRNAFLNYDSTYTFNTETAGAIAQNSSMGPTRDGRIKPDISAPGNFVLSCGNMRWVPLLISTGQTQKVAFNKYYVRNSGTSMASPQVAGAVALLLEKYPNLTAPQAKQLLLENAKKDLYTSGVANNTYGYGKLNVFQGLTFPAVFGCMDTAAYNYNPLANISDDHCIEKIYGCMDVLALNYNPLANTTSSTDTCVYAPEVGINEVTLNPIVSVYPSPATDKVYFNLPAILMTKTIDILDINGRAILHDTTVLNSFIWNCATMAKGIYIYKVKIGAKMYTGKIILN